MARIRIAAFLVVTEGHVSAETVENAIAAIRQIRGVQGVTTIYDDVGEAIDRVRSATNAPIGRPR